MQNVQGAAIAIGILPVGCTARVADHRALSLSL